ncbi:twin-arginine translocase TatA/TatE family subunit [Streptomyces sp. NPDC050264]|uniref:twin-arginine translocase TatA/TatE family subunit n=1 Tax=Streptomyces sp. NPDC050264 TaxID=3155038 RepID=UPI003435FEC9
MFGISEIGVVLIVIALLLCVKKLPELVRGAGKSARILKAEAKALKDNDDQGTKGSTPPRVIPGETVPPHDTEQGPRPQ